MFVETFEIILSIEDKAFFAIGSQDQSPVSVCLCLFLDTV
jgi:hypothetical protein